MIQDEKLFPLPTAYEKATGIRPHPATCHRHKTCGIKGVRLETIKCGGRRFTSVEAVQRFNAEITAAADGGLPKPRTERQRVTAIERAERELASENL
ncbi:DUF1580 domain-containing protein [Adhaeretor mobilis]|uniref:DUF1580 domain-containing protein n=1 Tax=Adhaeretor mobilis TaxID=1930276 RepID=A0A517MYP7_9BACT|nr:DUF1580 domain-containing protein [Adhaeretor mobilis]QDS99937.1 hypothetical protein HG15A2_32700 [Adhaeretor mobilis]